MIVSIHQPQYLPWLGYFDKIDESDIFVFLDNVQFKKNEWQNRNKIRTAQGWQWVTVPVIHKFPQKIKEVKINNSINWSRQHLNALALNYKKSRFFSDYFGFFEKLYSKKWTYLSQLNIYIIKSIIQFLGIKTRLAVSSQLKISGKATELLINICKKLGADTYLSGRGGRDYLNEEQFKKAKIKLIYQNFVHPIYKQNYQPFMVNLAIVDFLFSSGPDSLQILRRGRF